MVGGDKKGIVGVILIGQMDLGACWPVEFAEVDVKTTKRLFACLFV